MGAGVGALRQRAVPKGIEGHGSRRDQADGGQGEGVTMAGLLVLLCLVVLILVIVGSHLGLKHKIVVYDSRTDLHLTCVSLIVWAICGGVILAVRQNPANIGVLFLVLFLGGILSISPIRRSWQANKTVWNTILSVVTKYAMIVIITMLGIITIQSAFGAFEETKKKRYEDAAANALAAVGGAFGFMRVRKLINDLIVEIPVTKP